MRKVSRIINKIPIYSKSDLGKATKKPKTTMEPTQTSTDSQKGLPVTGKF